jgi:acetyl esterase/lipase
VLALVLAPAARAEEKKAAYKVGGDYEVEVKKNIPYYEGKDADAKRHSVDIYMPKGQKDVPVLFFIHGGGWTMGDRTMFSSVWKRYARNGVCVVSAGYRLSPKVKHPEHIKDVARAFAWTHKNIGKYGGKADQIFVSGHSAGGHLAALLGTDESYLKAHKLSLKDIKGVIPISGVFVIRASGRLKNAFSEDEDECKQASPQTHVKAGLPPFLVLYAEKDLGNLGAQGKAFAAALAKKKCDVVSREMKGRNHGSIVGTMTKQDDPGTQAVLEFIAKHSDLKLTTKTKEAKAEDTK